MLWAGFKITNFFQFCWKKNGFHMELSAIFLCFFMKQRERVSFRSWNLRLHADAFTCRDILHTICVDQKSSSWKWHIILVEAINILCFTTFSDSVYYSYSALPLPYLNVLWLLSSNLGQVSLLSYKMHFSIYFVYIFIWKNPGTHRTPVHVIALKSNPSFNSTTVLLRNGFASEGKVWRRKRCV